MFLAYFELATLFGQRQRPSERGRPARPRATRALARQHTHTHTLANQTRGGELVVVAVAAKCTRGREPFIK